MYPQSQVETLEAARAAVIGQMSALRKAAWEAQIAAFKADDGCGPCRGRGWVVVWDTMDSMDGGYAEYGTCTACSGKKGVLHPQGTKYDRWNVGSSWTYPETAETAALAAAISKAEYAISKEKARWEVHAGCIVTPARKSTAKGALPMGSEATVIKYCQNPAKVWVKDSSGQSFWPTVGSLKVICPKDAVQSAAPVQIEKKDTDMPRSFKVKIGKKTEKAALVVFLKEGSFANEQTWIPFSQVPALSQVHGEVVISIPDWLVKAKGIEQYALPVEVAVPAPVAVAPVSPVPAPVPVGATMTLDKLLTAFQPTEFAAPTQEVKAVIANPAPAPAVKLTESRPVSADVLDILFND